MIWGRCPKMTENHIRRVPVVDKEELVGLVDCLRSLTKLCGKWISAILQKIYAHSVPTTWERTPLK